MDSRERYDDPEVMLRAMLAGLQSMVWTALPGAIVSFDAEAVTAVVQPGIAGVVSTQDGKTKSVNMPVLVDVPVVFPRGGGCTLTFPVAAGDECLIVFASRAIDGWAQSGGVQTPSDSRKHALSDAIVILGPQSQANKISGISTSTTQLRSDDGSTYVELDATGQVLNFVAPGGCNFTTPEATFSGKITAQENIASTNGDVLAGTVSLKNHVHTNVTSGTSLSGKPQQ